MMISGALFPAPSFEVVANIQFPHSHNSAMACLIGFGLRLSWIVVFMYKGLRVIAACGGFDWSE